MFRNKVRPFIIKAIQEQEDTYFTKEGIVRAVFRSDPRLDKVAVQLERIQGWGLGDLMRAQVLAEVTRHVQNARDKRKLPLYRSFPVPGGPRRYMLFSKMGYSHLAQLFSGKTKTVKGMLDSLSLDSALLGLLKKNPELTVGDVIMQALKAVGQEKLLDGPAVSGS